MMKRRVESKVALITGGAQGLGEAIANRLAEEGASVVVGDINGDKAKTVADQIIANGGSALAFTQDVTDQGMWKKAVDQTVETFGHLDILVNNAGVVFTCDLEKVSLESWQKTMHVNLDGVFMGTQAAIGVMKNRGGSIINISSVGGFVGEPLAAAYTASKGGVRIFTKSTALHCAQKGYKIRVNSVHPGMIHTAMTDNPLNDEIPEKDAEAFIKHFEDSIPLGHYGEPLDIANGVLFLASDESKYMTGSELVIDGGLLAH